MDSPEDPPSAPPAAPSTPGNPGGGARFPFSPAAGRPAPGGMPAASPPRPAPPVPRPRTPEVPAPSPEMEAPGQPSPSPGIRRLYVVAGIVAGALILLVALKVSLGILKPAPWQKSPHAEAMAPENPTPFLQAIYTIDLMRLAEEACLEGYVTSGSQASALPPSLEAMVQAGMIESRAAWDAWGNPMRFDPANAALSSSGADGAWDTPDDVVKKMYQSAQVPESYWAPAGTLENTAQRHAMETVEMHEAALDFRASTIRMNLER